MTYLQQFWHPQLCNFKGEILKIPPNVAGSKPHGEGSIVSAFGVTLEAIVNAIARVIIAIIGAFTAVHPNSFLGSICFGGYMRLVPRYLTLPVPESSTAPSKAENCDDNVGYVPP
ncbi:hypothetical protein BS47DRAFT_1365425 [Hydnum rufescens UP504]|uniref:Uncharacterized protein n=1 Tax=Hydnum rufescens UP504 TaxID=1448309 RepID=A0A9P6ANZ6_9AGAM|nr:hypothetical protein BS47DRAFT_1365425 [Hydnum rufescens UP504]